MHFFPFNIGDYGIATAHLDEMEDLAYRRLMDLYYSSEKPIPLDLNEVARKIRMRSHSESIANVLSEFFTEEDDGFHSERIDIELFKYQEKSDQASKSAKARWKKHKEKQKLKASCKRIAKAEETHSEGNAKQEPRTKNKEPLTNSRFSEFWDMYGKKTSRAKCESKFNKLGKSDIEKIFEVLPDYVASTPNVKFRKDPATWLNGKCWNDEIQKSFDMPIKCNIDFSLLASNFNEAMANWEGVPEVIKVTDKQKEMISILERDFAMTDDRFKAYFNHIATSEKFRYFVDGVNIPPQNLTFFLKEDTIQR